jgi:hypothetical protein
MQGGISLDVPVHTTNELKFNLINAFLHWKCQTFSLELFIIREERKFCCLRPEGEGNASKNKSPASIVSHRREVIYSGKVCQSSQEVFREEGVAFKQNKKLGLLLATLPLLWDVLQRGS